jgi:hypothetical protein
MSYTGFAGYHCHSTQLSTQVRIVLSFETMIDMFNEMHMYGDWYIMQIES